MAKVIKLTENQFGEMMAYHGTKADFDKFNHKKYLSYGAGSQCFGWGTYVTNDIAVANGYVKASKGNGEKGFFLSLDPRPYLESLGKYDEETINEILEAYNANVVEKLKNRLSPTIATILRSINSKIKRKEERFVSLDQVLKMYGKHPWFTKASDEEKAKQIEIEKNIIAEKERPVIILRACADIINHFKPEMKKTLENRFAYLYEVDIPDDDGFNYLSWYDELDRQQIITIHQTIDYFASRYNNTLNNFWECICGYKGKDYYQALIWCFEHHFKHTNSKADSAKAASLFLLQCGFDGIKYPSGTRWQKPDGASEDDYNYVIFDANKVKIVNKTKV